MRIFKIVLFSLLGLLILLIIFWRVLFLFKPKPASQTNFGVTFSQKQADYLNSDWKTNYLAILDDLKVKKIRLAVYWDLVQKNPSSYDFSDLNWQLDEAQKRGVKVILAIGRRVPRWPECHIPQWAQNLPEKEQEKALLNYLDTIVTTYRGNKTLEMWQVENEPSLNMFGNCPKRSRSFTKEEVKLVKSIDPSHSVMTTDSGELATWLRNINLTDYLGTSVYRTVYNNHFGYINYGHFLPPIFYKIRTKIIGKNTDQIIISELQGEPWPPGSIKESGYSEIAKSMNEQKFIQNIEYAKFLGFSDIYLWGVEWWFFEKNKGNNYYWDTFKDYINSSNSKAAP
jgi:hypothetical protein